MLSTPATISWDVVHPESADELELGVAIAWPRVALPTKLRRRE
jgi:hypothetical protein